MVSRESAKGVSLLTAARDIAPYASYGLLLASKGVEVPRGKRRGQDIKFASFGGGKRRGTGLQGARWK